MSKRLFEDNDMVLSPFVTLTFSEGRVMVKNVIYNFDEISLHALDDLSISDITIDRRIFISKQEITKEKEAGLHLLERTFSSAPNRIGYIETTSRCPYKCKMCPKGSNKLVRENVDMQEALFKRIVNQLKYQSHLTLHLFGDPLFDDSIIERIEQLNKLGICPSFSTNMCSVDRDIFSSLAKIRIQSLTISCDTLDSGFYSFIRGNKTQNSINASVKVIQDLCRLNESKRFINQIIIQRINFKGSSKFQNNIIESFKKYKYVEFYCKPYIKFPLTNTILFNSHRIAEDRQIWLYNILDEKLPFKCLKVWNKAEYGVTSDGFLVPCCLSFNNYSNLGNLQTDSIKKVFSSFQLRDFRSKIYCSNSLNPICRDCSATDIEYDLQTIPDFSKDKLKLYCINDW